LTISENWISQSLSKEFWIQRDETKTTHYKIIKVQQHVCNIMCLALCSILI
jgi:hypothetical protein